MSKHLLKSLHRSFFQKNHKPSKRRSGRSYRRTLAMESLENRQMLSITPLQSLGNSGNTGEKPQSKVFEYAGQWWTVMPNKTGTWVFRLDGTSWTPTQQISTNKSVHADVKLVGDLAHVLLFNGTSTQLATLQYDAGPDNRFEAWSLQPQLVNVPLTKGVETATIEVDSTGRMWIASDVKTTVEVRYSDGLYTSWSAPITVASGIKSDDISAIIAMPNDTLGVFWSNQATKRFGFKVHVDGADATAWSADEVPGSQSALNVGHGMADDHMHLAVASDGTLYAAVKTSYDKSGYAKIGLLVRRPNGTWDNFYAIDNAGTRPVVVVDEVAGKLIVAHTTKEGGGDIVYRESPLDNISFGPKTVLISGGVNNVTTTKSTSTNQIVFLASSKGVLFSFDTAPPAALQTAPPNVVTTDDPPTPPVTQPGTNDATSHEVAFQNDISPYVAYVGTTDTQISSSSVTKNYGTATTLEVDGSPDIAALLKWDVSAIPTNSVIVSAAIELNITNATTQNYEVYAMERAWDELSATWQQAAAGNPWGGAGASGPGDRGTEILGQLASTNKGTYRIQLNDAGVAAVQAWINDSSLNYGIILQDYLNSDVAGISSSETSTASLRPKLIVNYEDSALDLSGLPNVPGAT